MREITTNLPDMEAILVSDVEVDNSQGRITVYGLPDQPGFASQVFGAIAKAGISVDMIVQNAGTDKRCPHRVHGSTT